MTRPRVPPAFARAVAAHRSQLERVVKAGAVSKIKGIYEEAQDELLKKLRKSIRGGRGDTFSAHQQRQALVQVRQGQAIAAQRMAGAMGPLSKNAQAASLKGLVNDVARLSKVYTGSEVVLPIEEASTMAGVIGKRAPSLLRMHKTSMARYGVNVVQKVEKKMALSLLTQETPGEAIEKVAQTIDGEWWQGERIVRTEMAYAFNAAHKDGIEESSDDFPEMMMRWEENCDEAGNPLDDRVAVDSLAMHGQLAAPDDVFTMPATSQVPDKDGNTEVPKGLIGKSWEFPPNRPNDRSVVQAWMREWGVPGWTFVGGRRVWLNR